MPVPIDFHHDVHTVGNGCFVGGDYGPSNASVLRVEQHFDTRVLVLRFDKAATALWAGVIYRIDGVNFGADSGDHSEYMLGDFVAGDGDGNVHLGLFQKVNSKPAPRRQGSERRQPACANAAARREATRLALARS